MFSNYLGAMTQHYPVYIPLDQNLMVSIENRDGIIVIVKPDQ
jgi:hypothetical protein